MKRDPTKERPKSVERLAEFTWRVYRGGYKWIPVADHGHEKDPGPYTLASEVDAETEERDADSYEPSRVEPGLFRAFASILPSRRSILDFANHYGRLGGTVETADDWRIFTDSDQKGFMAKVEPLRSWVFEMLFMRAMVDLWLAVQAGDERAIKKHIQRSKRVAVFQSGPLGAILRLPVPPLPDSERDPSSPSPWVATLDSELRTLSIRGWVVHPKRDPPKLVERLQSEWIETALYFLKVVVNRKLVEHSIERPTLQLVRHEQLGWRHVPSSLIGLLWLQFADAIATNRIFKQCARCNRWFETAQNLVRSDKLYCSQTCRVRAYRTRQSEVRELHSLGSTVDELAERFGSDPKTIRAWLEK